MEKLLAHIITEESSFSVKIKWKRITIIINVTYFNIEYQKEKKRRKNLGLENWIEMEWPLYTESESDFGAELKWRDNSNCHVAGRDTYITPSILRDCYNGKEGQGPVYSLLPQPHSKREVNSTK